MLRLFSRHKSNIEIDPTNLSDQHAGYLKALLSIYHNPSELTNGEYSLYNPKTKRTIKITLTHTLIKKVKEPNAQPIEYYVKHNNKFANGSYGKVIRALGTLVDHDDSRFSFYKKARVNKKQPAFQNNKPSSNAVFEPIISSFVPHLHAKIAGNSIDNRYLNMVMKEFAAQTLGEIIDNKSQLTKIASIRRITITLNLMRALRDQVHQYRVIHRDVKPDNIMVDKVGNVYFIDFGLSRFDVTNEFQAFDLIKNNPMFLSVYTSLSRQVSAGSIAYMSPETSNGLANNQYSDIYSLGLLLLEFWGLKSRTDSIKDLIKFMGPFYKVNPITVVTNSLNKRLHEPAYHDFADFLIGNLKEDLARRIYTTIMQLIAFEPNNRLKIDDAIEQFERIRYECILDAAPVSGRKYINAALNFATNMRQRLDKLAQHDYLLDYKELKNAFNDEVANIDESFRAKFLKNSAAFDIFKELLCVNGFAELNNFGEVIHYLKLLSKCFWQNFSRVNELIKNVRHVLALKENELFKPSLSKLSAQKLDLFLKDSNHIALKFQNRRIHIDDLSDFNKRCDQTLSEIETKFYSLINPFFKCKANHVIAYYDRISKIREICEHQNVGDELDAIKNSIKQAILIFINEIDSFNQLIKESELKLNDRSILVSPLVELVTQVSDGQELTDRLNAILKQLEVSSDYGRRLSHGVNQALHPESHKSNPTRRFKL